ncbi:peptidase [Flavobacterium sp. GSP27]|uniref:Peptidase n=1 Tax=Flavobacterium bomense TaxID=2497483 RepID=A0A3S0QAB4_9FLAO|nr:MULTISPECIES: peptidase [Flavobacterium]RTY96358.1 peptidase [Flavobacterium sp. GSN2]RTY70370.1 peptidase [Flavobacterium sp. LB2P53]RTY81275.1 peptidase [Flavobacterium sp. ZB4P23]RTY85233.1 peptidase [Flavobacterium sp. LS1P28]RTY92635.1 peptidase [Flavobacterium sp. RSP46]
MPDKGLKRQKLKENLFNKRRLIILNEDTFEETFSLKLTLMNVFVVATLGAIIITFVTTFIIAFTPLREFIPGYSSSKLKKDAMELSLKSDSLSRALKQNEAYIQSIQKVLTGELEYAKFNKDSILAEAEEAPSQVDMSASKQELELRQQVAQEEKNVNSLRSSNKGKGQPPIK